MEKLVIRGGAKLAGTVQVSGAKNAALPILAASILSDRDVDLSNVPDVADVHSMIELLQFHGMGKPVFRNGRLTFNTRSLSGADTPYDIVRRMRASFLVLAPLVARFGHARISRPGGCAIGTRPVEMHLEVMTTFGAEVTQEQGYIIAHAKKGLTGDRCALSFPSVGATHTALMAAAGASGETEILNAAREPEVVDLAAFLTAMGAQVEGAGTHRILVQGNQSWQDARHAVVPDRIEVASYLIAAAMTDGELEVVGGRLEHLGATCRLLESAGLSIIPSDRGLIARPAGRLKSVDLTTEPFPGFPTDLQAQFMAMMCLADGVSVIKDRIFEARFMHLPELQRLGADIRQDGAMAIVRGVPELRGAEVMATDLRASMSLVLAGLVAKGQTVVHRVYHLDRGYEDIEGKLRRCGADIERMAS